MGGACGGAETDPRAEAVGKELDDDRRADKRILKLLLLGAGGSGKSTFFKQLRTIHEDGFTPYEITGFKRQIHRQILEGIQSLITQCKEAQKDPADYEDEEYTRVVSESEAAEYLIDEDYESSVREIVKLNAESSEINETIGEHISVLWTECKAIKLMYERYRNKLAIADSTSVFLNSIKRIGDKKYEPNADDVLLVRHRTTGMTERVFKINGTSMKIVDVGGQRNERKKWIHFFDGVAAVLFVVALSCYNEVPFEDVVDLDVDLSQKNNMLESVSVFDQTANGITFRETPIILFLNKSDLMKEKIEKVPITVAFKEYDGEQEFEACVTYIRNYFMQLNKNPKRDMFAHITCATDKNNVTKVFNDVQVSLVNDNLAGADLM